MDAVRLAIDRLQGALPGRFGFTPQQILSLSRDYRQWIIDLVGGPCSELRQGV